VADVESTVRYAVTCARCGALIAIAERVRDAEARAIDNHLRAEHPAVLSRNRVVSFDWLIGQARLRMVN
jgi:hypothetical protein